MISERTGPAHGEQADLHIRELIRILFDQLANNGRPDATKFRILKALYLVRGQLPESNPIKKSLAFYWYRYGPFSETIVKVLDSGKPIIKNFDGSYRYSDEDRKTPLVPYDQYVREASDKITPIAKKLGKDAMREVYDDAPYQWYEHYIDFKDRLYAYYDHERRGLPNPYTHNDILESLDETLETIPTEDRFREFHLTYNDFIRVLLPLLKRHNVNDYEDAFESLCRLSEDIWAAFAKGVRIRYHDRYYERLVKEWQNDYQASLSRLVKDIDDVHKMLPDGYQDPPDAKIEVLDFDVDSAKVYTPDELLREIDRITSGKD